MAKEITTSEPIDGESHPGVVARLLQYSRGRHIALPPHTTIELIENPQVLPVPGSAYYGHGLMAWQGQHSAMIELEVLLRAIPGGHALRAPRYALVVAYQRAAGLPIEHGAIALAQLPESVTVSDAAACALPGNSDLWPVIALSCFQHEGQPVPVVDTSKLFGAYHG
jgi:chemotaxis signal transduction protein